MNTYKLLTPGPLTTTDTVKQEMLVDRCTWDDDYKAVTQKIRRQLLELAHVSPGAGDGLPEGGGAIPEGRCPFCCPGSVPVTRSGSCLRL